VKKQKVVLLDNEQQSNLDLDAIHKLNEGLSKIDNDPIYTPNLQWFENMVLAEQEKTKRKLRKELSVFLLIALIILSGIIIAILQMPLIFIFLQIITSVFIVLYTSSSYLKKVKLDE
jgi:hypothetical protein